MSVFNQTYESLLEDGYCELSNLDLVYAYMKHLHKTDLEYSIKYKWNWIDECDAWLIEIKR